MAAEDGFDTASAISALESTMPLFSDTFQLASMVLRFIPGMSGVAGVLSGVSSVFDKTGKVLDGIDQVRGMCDKIIEIYERHPDPAAQSQVAGALITKAFTLVESGHFAEALLVYDELVSRFGADTETSVVRLVRRAQINTTGVSNKLERFEETLTRSSEVVERYGTDPDPVVVADVMVARVNRMAAFGELDRTGEAFSCFDEIVEISNRFDSGGPQDLGVQVRENHVSALCIKSEILRRHGEFDEALAVSGEAVAESDEVAGRFGANQHPEIRRGVALSLSARAAVLHHFGRWQEEIDAYDKILTAYSEDRSLRDLGLNAARGKFMLLLQLGRIEEATHARDDILREFPGNGSVKAITTTLEAEGYQVLGQHEKALKACDEVADMVGSHSDVVSGQLMTHALLLKVKSLSALRRMDEIPSVCNEVTRRAGSDPDLILQQAAARAMLYKGDALVLLEQWGEAAATMNTIVARYGEDADPVLRDLSARARNKIAALGQLNADL